MAPSLSATAGTSSTTMYRNSASGSTNRRMSQGHATRSTLAFFRVTHFMTALLAFDLSGPGLASSPFRKYAVTYAANDPTRRPIALMPDPAAPRWLVLVWRLPSGSSTPRVTIWRSLRRLGAAVLTPGAAILPYRDDLQEQLDWLAQEIEEQDGVAW